MGLSEARAHVESCPKLKATLPRRGDWLAAQAACGVAERHPLYRWLELPDDWPETVASVRALCAALESPIAGDVASRRHRLVSGDAVDYHSAVCELYMAAALVECGLSVSLGNPDLTVRDAADTLYVELTSAQKGHGLPALQADLTEALGPLSAGAELTATHDTMQITTTQRRRIVAAALAVAETNLVQPTAVDLSGILPKSAQLRLAIVPQQPFVGLHGSWVHAGSDPGAIIADAISAKRSQLQGFAPSLLGVELSGSDWSSHLWAIRVAYGEIVRLDVPERPELVGVLAYWQGRGALRPYMTVWLPNEASRTPAPDLLRAFLECLRDQSITFPLP